MNNKEYEKVKSTYRFGKIRFILWTVLAFICLNNIDTSMWWLMGGVFFGIILLIDMIITGLGIEYAIKGSGFEDKAEEDGLYMYKGVKRNNKDNNKSDEDKYNEKLHFME